MCPEERGVLHASEWWCFEHPPRGSCLRGCPSYGRCHCGCGETPSRATYNLPGSGRVQGEPYVFRSGHQARVLPRRGGHWTRHGVPVERVRPLLRWLHQRHGDWRTVAAMLRMPVSTIKGYANNHRRRRVPPLAARRVSQLVLAHRKRGTWLDQWETPPGVRDDRSA